MEPELPIDSQSCRTKQFGKLAGTHSPGEIHLEEAILGMQKTGSPSGIHPIASEDRGNTEFVPLDDHPVPQSCQVECAVKFRQTSVENEVKRDTGRD